MTNEPDAALVEAVARLISPSSWAVMDGYLEQTKRKYHGQNVGWPADQFQHKESMEIARHIIPIVAEACATIVEDRMPVVQCMSVEPIVSALNDAAKSIRHHFAIPQEPAAQGGGSTSPGA